MKYILYTLGILSVILLAGFIYLILFYSPIAKVNNPNPELFAKLYGNPKSDKVLIYAQGGPMTELETSTLTREIGFVGGEDILYVLPYQVQTQEVKRFETTDLSFEEAKKEANISTEILTESIKYFKNQGKKVYVVGISYGAFVATDSIASAGVIADDYLIIVGRLDMPEKVWGEFAQGKPVGFIDGKEVTSVSLAEAGMGGVNQISDRNMMRLAAGLGYKKYTSLLKDTDLSAITYVYGSIDEQVGTLSKEEVSFLETQGAKVIRVDGNHWETVGSQEVTDEYTKRFE